MKYLNILIVLIICNCIFIVSSSSSSSNSKECPCESSYLCEPVSASLDRQEFVGYSLNSTAYHGYYWDGLTTLSVFYPTFEDELLCIAHELQVRLVYGMSYPLEQLGNSTYQSEWIQQQLELVINTFADGINFDFESPITNETTALQYTELVASTNKAFKSVNPNYQISVDVAWSPSCIDKRCYDYAGLADASDFLIMMDYDERSQIFGTTSCTAGANSQPDLAIAGLKNFTDLGITTNQLVMGLPWYAYDYPCLNSNEGLELTICQVKSIPFRGAYCSDAAGTEIDYMYIMDMLNDQTINSTILQWSTEWSSPYFNYLNSTTGVVHQVWFDNPTSLTIKVEIAKQQNLKGVAVWNIDFLNYADQYNSLPMWDALTSFFSQ